MSVASSRVDTHEEMVVAENIVDQTSVSDVIEASQQPISDLENEYLGDFHDHTYGCNSKSINTEPVSPKTGFQIIVDEMSKMKEENDELREEVSELKQEILSIKNFLHNIQGDALRREQTIAGLQLAIDRIQTRLDLKNS